MNDDETVKVYDLNERYHIGVGQAKDPKSKDDQEQRHRARFDREGIRRTVRAALLVHVHDHAHVLLLQNRADSTLSLPGGTLRPGESEEEGLLRSLTSKLASAEVDPPAWAVGPQLGQLWRPAFGPSGLLYPYVPPHVTRPVEHRKVFLVSLPETCVFAVPPAYQLLAIPLFELHNAIDSGFSADIASLPTWMSNLNVLCQ